MGQKKVIGFYLDDPKMVWGRRRLPCPGHTILILILVPRTPVLHVPVHDFRFGWRQEGVGAQQRIENKERRS